MNNESRNPAIWLGLIGGLLAVFNNVVATLTLGVAQGPIVALSTPFAFVLGKLMFPKLPTATIMYIPLVIVSIFTVNLGPPGAYKFLYLAGPILYDLVGYISGLSASDNGKVPLWKLLVSSLFYPVGLFLGAFAIVSWFAIQVPLMSKGGGLLIIGGVVFFQIFGLLATWIGHKIYYKFIDKELKM